jgi:pimeloyl-ACP methyl ester carboxylesterase
MKKSIVSNGCVISYDFIKKDNAPTIVLLHGYGVNRKMWRPQLDFISDKYTVINIDVRGHGESRPCSNFSIKEAASDLRNILLAEQCEKAILIGLSMGGYIVQEYAFVYGGALGYMIVGSTPILLPCYSKFEKFVLNHSAAMMKLYPWNYMKNEMTKACSVTEQGRKIIRPMFDELTQREFIESWKGIATCLHEEEMEFDAPLLVVCGEKDKTGSIKKCMKFWESSYKGSEVKFLANAGHVASLDNIEEFNDIMIGFISSCKER